MAKNTNIVPGDEEIVTKKGFLITPPKQTRRKNPLADRIAAERADEQAEKNRQNGQKKTEEPNKNRSGNVADGDNGGRHEGEKQEHAANRNPHRGGNRNDRASRNDRANKNERFEKVEKNANRRTNENDNESRNANESGNGNKNSGDRRERYDRNDRNRQKDTSFDRANRPPRAKGEKAENGERGEKIERTDKPERTEKAERGEKFEHGEKYEKRGRNGKGAKFDRDRKNDRAEKGVRTEKGERGERFNKNEKNEKNENGAKSGGNTGRDRKGHDNKRREKRSILVDLGFNPDNFGRRGGFSTEEEEVEEIIDYSKAIPLREQIYPPKKEETAEKNTTTDTPDDRPEIIGVRFKEAGKIYYFDPDGNEIAYGTPVIVETARGMEYGYTAISNRRVPVDEVILPLKKIVRLATDDDKQRLEANIRLEKSAGEVFVEKVQKLKLDMHLVGVEYTFDNTKLLFYFASDGRVDFRELVKELASVFRTRIELRQVGVRDEAKLLGGLGVCGRPLCCKMFLGEFAQVSIKMAKDQNLSLNSSKISGTCGRLLCCLRYEDEVYRREYERTPRVDAIVETKDGKGVVTEANPLKGIVKVRLFDNAEAAPQPYHRDEVRTVGYQPRGNKNDAAESEIEIEETEKNEE